MGWGGGKRRAIWHLAQEKKKPTQKYLDELLAAGVKRLIGCNGPQQEVCVIYGLQFFSLLVESTADVEGGLDGRWEVLRGAASALLFLETQRSRRRRGGVQVSGCKVLFFILFGEK